MENNVLKNWSGEVYIKEQNSEVKFYKNYLNVDDFDFNTLANVIDTVNARSLISSNYMNDLVLEACFQIRVIQSHPYFNNIWENFEREFNKDKSKESSIDIFFSYCAGGRSISHRDREDIYIFGLYGKTIYIVEGEEYSICKGDLIHIPKGFLHRAIAITPRIIGSYSTW